MYVRFAAFQISLIHHVRMAVDHMKYAHRAAFNLVFQMTIEIIPTKNGVNNGLKKECLGAV